MSLPKEPRQLMINLMYLVLTALLAMNVSSEILNAFKIVDTSINQSSKNIADRSASTIDLFREALADKKVMADPVKFNKVKTAMGYAEQAIAMRNTLETDILAYKNLIIQRAGGIDPETNDILRRDDLDAATAVMIETEKKGPEMLAKMQAFKKAVAALVPPGNEGDMKQAATNDSVEKRLPLNFDVLPSEENKTNDWSYGNFHMVPAVGAITIIDKYINDIRNSESIVMDELWAKAFGEKRRQEQVFTKYDVLLSSASNYLLPGEKYSAEVMLGAYNDKVSNLVINVNGRPYPVKDGKVSFSTIAAGKGEQSISVSASYTDPNDGTNKSIPAKQYKYYVGEAQASISLDKMNVFYIGVDNPITLAASGVPAGSLVPTAENCVLTRADGVNKFMVRVTNPGKAKISLSAKLSDGTSKNFGTYEYRVKRIPDPYPVVAGRRGGVVAANELKVQEAVFARLDNFDFDVKFEVTSFDISRSKRRSSEIEDAKSTSQYLTGPKANSGVADIMGKITLGDKIYIENIKAKGPDGTSRNIGSVNFTVNQ